MYSKSGVAGDATIIESWHHARNLATGTYFDEYHNKNL